MIIKNVSIATRDSEKPWYKKGAVLICNNRICDIGEGEEMCATHPEEEVFEGEGKLLMPGIINAHGHIYSSLARGIALLNYHPNNFQEILEGLWWKIDAHLNIEEVEVSAYNTFIESIKNGVTTMIDHHASFSAIEGSLECISKVGEKLNIRRCLCFEVSDRHGLKKAQRSIEENVNFIEYVKKANNHYERALFGLHASFTLSDDTLKQCVAQSAGVGFHVHVAEGQEDFIHASQRGMGVVERLDTFGVLNKDTLVIHGIHIKDCEYKILKERGVTVIHNPQSNMANAVGYCNVKKYFDYDIPVGLGTDGYTMDVLESAKFAHLMMKHQNEDAKLGWIEPPIMLFENNAAIASKLFDENIGKIKKGYVADLILLDYDPITPIDGENVDGHLHFGINGKNVTHTMIGGKWVMKDRKIVNVDEQANNIRSRKCAEMLWNRMR